jgi:hypothetical protein
MPAKKAAKKSAKKHDHKPHHFAKEMRRGYEHLGRVQGLQRFADPPDEDVSKLLRMAQEESSKGEARNVAELLRGAEHLSFAGLVDQAGRAAPISDEVETALEEEFHHLRSKAEERWEGEDADPALAKIYGGSLQRAARAAANGHYRQAMELVRAAEALAHVKRKLEPKKLSASGKSRGGRLRELAAS